MKSAPALAVERLLFDLARGEVASARPLLAAIGGAGALYGVAMGSFACDSWERSRLMLYVGIKVPLLLLVSTTVCLPGFFALNAFAGLSAAFGRALRAILMGQAAIAVSLASLGPVTLFAYASGASHDRALLVNGAVFAASTAIGQVVLRRCYRDLVAEDGRHRFMLGAWVALYGFVGIQMGWVLRPFVGDPERAVSFFRDEPFSNAYVVVADLAFSAFSALAD